MKVLNLYAGIGGNRKLWQDVDVTAVEWDEEIAEVYSDHFPKDNIIVEDAHKYLLNNYQEFDFIWSSPPCQTHSRSRFWGWAKKDPKYPDMKLYQEIIFISTHFDGKWVVENVEPYYNKLMPRYHPMIKPNKKIGRHLFWSNFKLGNFNAVDGDIHKGTNKTFEDVMGYDLSDYNPSNGFGGQRQKLSWLRNCVQPETGKYILDRARDIIVKSDTEQTSLEL